MQIVKDPLIQWQVIDNTSRNGIRNMSLHTVRLRLFENRRSAYAFIIYRFFVVRVDERAIKFAPLGRRP
jgi:hypothetical protein